MGYELKKGKSGKFSFNLKAGNGQVILSSETYESKASAEGGIASCQKNGTADANFETKKAKDGSPFFVLKASNGQTIGKSEMYNSAAACKNGIESVKKNCGSTAVKDLTAA